VRAFVALDLEAPEPLRALPVRRPTHLHVTLHFFGELPEEQLPAVHAAMEAAATDQPPIDAALEGIGAFPGPRDPRVIWVGIAEGRGAIERLQGRLEAALAARGHPAEQRPFQAHATLFRVRGPRDRAMAETALAAGAGRAFGPQRIDALRLYESRLASPEPLHRRLLEVPLPAPSATR